MLRYGSQAVGLAFALTALTAIPAAQAQQPRPQAASPAGNEQPLRDYTLSNQTGQAITQARVRTTTGAAIQVNREIPPYGAQTFTVPMNGCVADVEVRFHDGHRLAGRLPDCRDPRIVVTNTNILPYSAASNRTPGADLSRGYGRPPLPALRSNP